ncbi:MAG TPA: helix-turn-helix transcriptional regulator [Bryobacteraceae bacterium]|nr:helix-turn-helix transcriptional regulator [Bryobacteraceae bacterium]
MNNKLELATIRRNRGLTLEQIASRTKISVRYLRAIEEGRLHNLPGGVYTSSYLRQYAAAIDYPGELVSGETPPPIFVEDSGAGRKASAWAWFRNLARARSLTS